MLAAVSMSCDKCHAAAKLTYSTIDFVMATKLAPVFNHYILPSDTSGKWQKRFYKKNMQFRDDTDHWIQKELGYGNVHWLQKKRRWTSAWHHSRAGSRGVQSVQWHRALSFRGPTFSVYTSRLIMNSDPLQGTIFKVYTALESQKRQQNRQADILEATILHSKPHPIILIF